MTNTTEQALRDALEEERRLRIIGQQPDIHRESIRDMRRACYAATDAALSMPPSEQEPVAPRAFRTPDVGTPWWQTAKDCGAWTDRNEGDVGYVHFGSVEALRVYTMKVCRQAEAAAIAAHPAPQPAEHRCLTCNGHGLVGGHMQDGSGFAEACPECNGSGKEAQPSEVRAVSVPEALTGEQIALIDSMLLAYIDAIKASGEYERWHYIPEVDDMRDRLSSLSSPQAPSVPDGYALVPVEPTPGMLMAIYEAMKHLCSPKSAADAYSAMLAAAPQASVPDEVRKDAERWNHAMDWGVKDFAVCRRIGRTGQCWEPIKTSGPIDAALAEKGGK